MEQVLPANDKLSYIVTSYYLDKKYRREIQCPNSRNSKRTVAEVNIKYYYSTPRNVQPCKIEYLRAGQG